MRLITWYLGSAFVLGILLGIAAFFLGYENQLREFVARTLTP